MMYGLGMIVIIETCYNFKYKYSSKQIKICKLSPHELTWRKTPFVYYYSSFENVEIKALWLNWPFFEQEYSIDRWRFLGYSNKFSSETLWQNLEGLS